ncbi:MAG: hypothetical protein HUU01_05555 [Saprospiraceae bacterium]|nr:hypothetical protein [Saprospiraceae bacterium]
MRRISFFVLPLFFFCAACSTDFELEAEWRDIPIVYGMLTFSDTAHYIRLEKAFLPDGGDARDVAQIADSLYYGDHVSVQLQNLRTGNTVTLQKVDGALEGYPREDGPFATQPNYLYKVKAGPAGILPGDGMKLIINRGDNLPEVTAETKMLEAITLPTNGPVSPIRFGPYGNSTTLRWFAGPSAKVFDLRLIIHYRESNAAPPQDFESKELEWVLTQELERPNPTGEQQSYAINNEALYIFIKNSLPVDPNAIRVLDFIDFKVSAAGQELVDLLDIIRINAGITSSQSIPKYTNISEGLGIFSSRVSALRPNLTLDGVALDTLRLGIHTKNLNFQ